MIRFIKKPTGELLRCVVFWSQPSGRIFAQIHIRGFGYATVPLSAIVGRITNDTPDDLPFYIDL